MTLQWSDRPTLNFLASAVHEITASDKNTKNNCLIMMVYTCQGNEVPIEHPLAVVLRELECDEVWVNDIELDNLTVVDVEDMIASLCKPMTADEVASLAQFVIQKTQGNAFFVGQYNQQCRMVCGRGFGPTHNSFLPTTLLRIHPPFRKKLLYFSSTVSEN